MHFITSSGTARMLVNPLRNTTKTLDAPHRSAEVAQSNAVSPAPRTMTFPAICGSDFLLLHAHIPNSYFNKKTNTNFKKNNQ
jgi:hypothetical protein